MKIRIFNAHLFAVLLSVANAPILAAGLGQAIGNTVQGATQVTGDVVRGAGDMAGGVVEGTADVTADAVEGTGQMASDIVAPSDEDQMPEETMETEETAEVSMPSEDENMMLNDEEQYSELQGMLGEEEGE